MNTLLPPHTPLPLPSELVETLHRFNPWWRGEPTPPVPATRRHIVGQVRQHLEYRHHAHRRRARTARGGQNHHAAPNHRRPAERGRTTPPHHPGSRRPSHRHRRHDGPHPAHHRLGRAQHHARHLQRPCPPGTGPPICSSTKCSLSGTGATSSSSSSTTPQSRSLPLAAPRCGSNRATTAWRDVCPPSKPALCHSPKSPNFGTWHPSNISRPKKVSGNSAD